MTNYGTRRLSVQKDTSTGQWIVRIDGFMAHVTINQPEATRWADLVVEHAKRTTAWRRGR